MAAGRDETYTLNALREKLDVSRQELIKALSNTAPAEDDGKVKRWTLRQVMKGLEYSRPPGRIPSSGKPHGPSWSEADVRLKALQAEKIELQNRRAKGELVPIDAAIRIFEGIVLAIKAKLVQMPSRLAPKLVGVRREGQVKDKLETQIHEVLSECSRWNPDDFLRELQRTEGSVGGGVSADGPATETDSGSVGGQE